MPNRSIVDVRAYGPLEAGVLRRRLTIQQAVNASDGYGGYTTTWSTVTKAWGAIVKPLFHEMFMGQQVRERVQLHYVIRYPPSTVILPGMRMVDVDSTGGGGATYTIVSAQDWDGRKQQMRLTVEQVAPGT